MESKKEFYKLYGQAVYALACNDGKVRRQERQALYDYVLKFLALNEDENDSSKMNIAFYSEFEFDRMEREHENPEKATENFIRFIHHQGKNEDRGLMQRATHGMEIVAASFKGTNQKEREFIERIQSEIREVLN